MPCRAARRRAIGKLLLGSGALCLAIAAPGSVRAQEDPHPDASDSPAQSQPAPASGSADGSPPDETDAAPPPPAEEAGPPAEPREAPRALAAAGDANVTMRDFAFVPAAVSVDVGDTVVWTNVGPDEPHTATAENGSFDTGTVAVGDSARHTFRRAGRFDYVCTLHANMKGTVTVGSPGGDGNDPAGGGESTSGDGTASDDGSTPTGAGAAPSEAAAATAPGAAGSSSSLPSTGQDELPLTIAGLGLLVAGALLRRAATFAAG